MDKKKHAYATYKDGVITITVTADLIRFAQKNNPDFPLKITKKNEDVMGEYIAKNILIFDEDADTGDTRFFTMLDDLIVDAFEIGEDWLEEISQY